MRAKFPTRTILLRTEQQREQALALLKHVPLDAAKPLELVVSEQQKKRGPDANSLMWAGPLRDLANRHGLSSAGIASKPGMSWPNANFCQRNMTPSCA